MEIQKVYKLSMDFSQQIWDAVSVWPSFAKETCGKQIVRSADSISANLKEGIGRYSFKERNQFNFFARGSLFETHCWIEKAVARGLIKEQEFAILTKEFALLELEINRMIRNTRQQTS